jgi:hypothetical protein
VPRTQVTHLKLEGLRLIDVAHRSLGVDVEVIDPVRVEGLGTLAGEDVRQAGGVGQAKDAPSRRLSASLLCWIDGGLH